jgi:putative ABC transport system permease protein
MSMLASWRTALRIARREARRAKGRSILVAAMLALPVLALTAAAVTNDMLSLTGAEQADRRMGTADARIQWPSHQAILQMPDPDEGFANVDGGGGWSADEAGTETELRAELPGSTLLPVRRGTAVVRTPDGLGQPDAVMIDASNPLTRGYVEVVDGRAPTGPREVALTKQAMEWLAAGIGDRITVVAGDSTRMSTVVGEVEFPSLLDSVLLFGYDGDDEAVGEWFSLRENSWLVDTPEPLDWNRVVSLNEQGMVVASRAVLVDPPPDDAVPMVQRGWRFEAGTPTEEVALGVLVGGLALLEVVLLAGPAFAISARRRQRQLALVAANGGTPAHVRRIVLADGVVLGVLGAVLGIVLGIAAAVVARPWMEEHLAQARAGAYRFAPASLLAITGIAIVTGVLAALVPAFITARQDVVASLQGRRGATRSRKRWIAVGITMIGVCALVTYVGTRASDTTIMLGGLIIGELGLVLCTPALVGLIARLGRIVPLAPRIALRDAARNRAAAAPAISAVMAAVAGSVALGMFLDSQTAYEREQYYQEMPTGTVRADFGYGGDDPANEPSLPAIEQALRTALPVADLYRVGALTCPAGTPEGSTCDLQAVVGDGCPQLMDWYSGEQLTTAERRAAGDNPLCDQRYFNGPSSAEVADGDALAALTGASGDDLRRAQETLAAGGVVVRSPLHITDGEVTLAVLQPDPDAEPDAFSDPDTRPTPGRGTLMVWPGQMVHYVTRPGYLLTTDVGPGPPIVSAATVTELGLTTDTSKIVGSSTRPPVAAEIERARLILQPLGAFPGVEEGYQPRWSEILLVLLAASAIITIGAASVGTALAAADSRADLSTLAAVGASPRLRRGLSLSQSWVIAGLGSVLGTAVGIATAVAVLAVVGQQYGGRLWPDPPPPSPVMPWSIVLVCLLVVPGVAILGAGLFTRSRLPIERRL